MDLSFLSGTFSSGCVGLHFTGRVDQRHLQRGCAVFSYCGRISAIDLAGSQECWRLDRAQSRPQSKLYPFVAGNGKCAY